MSAEEGTHESDGGGQSKDTSLLKHLPSELFDAAADGLEAADMLLKRYPSSLTPPPLTPTLPELSPVVETLQDEPSSDANREAASSLTIAQGLSPSPVEDKSGVDMEPHGQQMHPSVGSTETPLSTENRVEVSNDVSATVENVVQGLPLPLTEAEARLRFATLRAEPSQQFDYVAEGLDAADAKFEPVPELDELRAAEVAEDKVQDVQRLTAERRTSELLLEAMSPNVAATESLAPRMQASRTEELLPKKVITFNAGNSAITTDRDSDDDEDEDHLEGNPLAPRNWLNLLKEFTYQSDSRKGKLVLRDRAFHQTSNKMNIACMVAPNDSESWWGYRMLLSLDWFDTFLNYGTGFIILVLITIYTVHLVVFAAFYYAIALDCGSSEPMTYAQAFAFSLQTATTTGYTLPQPNNAMFFEGCPAWVVTIYFQCIYDLIFNGIVIGTTMLRYSRADRRSNQIIFSNKACVACIRGRFYLTLQCFDLQASQPIIGATVRMFAILHEVNREARALWQMRSMRLVRPDDEIGSKLWLSIPCIIMHEIDAWSPLAPSHLTRPPRIVHATAANRFPQPPQRAADGRAGSRSQTTCVVCGCAFITEAALRRHMIYAQRDEKSKGRPDNFGHLKVDLRNLTRPVVTRVEEKTTTGGSNEETEKTDHSQLPFHTVAPNVVQDALKARIHTRNVEIVCIIEGTDPHTAKTFQARHSYGPEDIAYDAQHAPCMGVGKDGTAEVNLSFFHQVDVHDTINIEEPMAFASHT